MADIKAQLKAKNGDNLYPVTSMAYVTATFNGGLSFNSSTNTLSTYRIPIASVSALTTSLSAKQAKCSAGFRTEINGATVSQKRYFDIESLVSGGTITVSAGCAYRILANTAAGVTLVSEPVANTQFGLEGHATIIMTNSSYLHLGSNVVLGQPLVTDAANNCTLRFHDGHCIIDVEDHDAAHTVTVATGKGTGSLYYFCSATNTNNSDFPQYISFSDALDGTACTFNGVSVTGEKHLLGNGNNATIVTGTASLSTPLFMTHLAVSGATITGGTVYANDVLIPAGATTVVSSPLIASNTLEINGTLKTRIYPINGLSINGSGVILGDGRLSLAINAGQVTTVNGVTLTGPASYNGIIANYGNTTLTNCLISGCTGTAGYITAGGSLTLSNCILTSGSWTTATGYKGVVVTDGGTLYVYDTTFTDGLSLYNGNAYFYGTVKLPANNMPSNKISSGVLTLTSGSILDLTGNTNATPINPGGGVVFPEGGATVYPSAGPASAMFMDTMNVPAIGNANNVPLGGGRVTGMWSSSYASNCIFSGGTAAFVLGNSSMRLTLDQCRVVNNASAGTSGGVWVTPGAEVTVRSSVISGNSGHMDVFLYGSGSILNASDSIIGTLLCNNASAIAKLAGSNHISVISGYGAPNGSVVLSSGAILDLTGNTNATPVNPGAITFAPGGATVYPSAGSASAYMLDNVSLNSTRPLTNTNVINLHGSNLTFKDASSTTIHRLSGCTITGGYMSQTDNAARGGVIYASGTNAYNAGTTYLDHVTLSGNYGQVGGAICQVADAKVSATNCIISGNTSPANLGDVYIGRGTFFMKDTNIDSCLVADAAGSSYVIIAGSNKIKRVQGRNATYWGYIQISSGAILDFTGNASANPINAPGSGNIVVSAGGCTVITSGGTTVSVAAGTYHSIHNDGTTTA